MSDVYIAIIHSQLTGEYGTLTSSREVTGTTTDTTAFIEILSENTDYESQLLNKLRQIVCYKYDLMFEIRRNEVEKNGRYESGNKRILVCLQSEGVVAN